MPKLGRKCGSGSQAPPLKTQAEPVGFNRTFVTEADLFRGLTEFEAGADLATAFVARGCTKTFITGKRAGS